MYYIMQIVEIILAIAVIAALYFYYLYWLQPAKLFQWYQQTIEAMGYKVLVYPYQPFKISIVESQKQCEKQYQDAYYHQKHIWPKYDVVISNTSRQITLTLINPQLIRQFFSPEKSAIFPKSHLNKYGLTLVLGNTLVLNEGHQWKRKRRAISQVFNFDFLKRIVPRIAAIAKRHIVEYETRAETDRKGSNIRFKQQMKPLFENITSDMVIQCFFGTSIGSCSIDGIPINRYLSQLIRQGRQHSTDPIVLLLGKKAYHWRLLPKYSRLYSKILKLKEVVTNIVKQRISQIQAKGRSDKYEDILEAVWGFNGDSQLIENELVQEFCAFMTAGNDSTSFFMNMILFYITQNAQIQDRVRKQISSVMGKQPIIYDNLRKLQYLQWVQLETNRAYGPATNIMLREASKDTYIDNIPICKGTTIKIELLASHYNEKHYVEPFKFNPSRWSQTTSLDPYAFGGFSYGARTCLGKQLAYITTKIITVELLERYQQIQVDPSSQISFIVRSFYTPTPFMTQLLRPLTQEEKDSTSMQQQHQAQECESAKPKAD